MQWIGSKYTSSPNSDSSTLYESTLLATQNAPISPFNVQALAIMAVAQHHDARGEARNSLDRAVDMAVALGMHEKNFAVAWGEGEGVLEESWRRTYFVLYGVELEFAVASRVLGFKLGSVPGDVDVDLPCDDGGWESGVSCCIRFEVSVGLMCKKQIPTPLTWAQYSNREYEEIQTTFASLVYAHDLHVFVASR